MPLLHMSKVAVGCGSLEALAERQRARIVNGTVPVYTRFRPKRAEELIGGSLYWIIKHRIAARQTILGFEEAAERRTLIWLDAQLVPVRPLPRRAHQGWRYLAVDDAPLDLGSGGQAAATLPSPLATTLAELGLI